MHIANNHSMKIVYCIDSLVSSGGTERVATTKLNWLASQPDVKTWVVTLAEADKPFFTLDKKVERIMLTATPGNKKAYKTELESLFNRIRPDVAVSVAGMSTETLPRLNDGSKKILEFHYTKNFLVNFVNGMHHIRFRQLHLLKMRWLQWKLARNARKFDIFVGLTKRDVGLWGNPGNMSFVYNPLSFRSDKKSDCTAKRIIAVGSWTPAKGMDQLLEAFGPLSHRYPDWKVDLYGSGQDKNLLLSIIEKYGMSSQVSLNQPTPEIGKELVDSSIYAFPSRSDGFGLVITEAMECGLPTVAMDCECGPREIVTSETGIVVPDKDIDAFRKALERLMLDESIRKRMGEAASREVVRFYPENIMPLWLELFKK